VTPTCPYCRGATKLRFVSQDYNRRISDEYFRHYLCKQCALLFIHPLPDDLERYYPHDYYYVPDSVDFLDENYKQEKYKIDIVQRFKTSGRLLEIGPSLGTFSYAAKQAGFEVNTIEMSTECSKYLNNVVKIPTVNTADTDYALLSLGPFDVIALWHVIEHLVNPWTTIEHIAKSLNPGGIFILAAPNPEAFQFKLIGRRWPHVDAPRHLYLIPQEVLIDCTRKYGLTLEFSTTDDEGARGWNTFGWEYWLANISLDPKRKAFMHRIGKQLARLLRCWDQKEGRGSAYTLVFRKAAS